VEAEEADVGRSGRRRRAVPGGRHGRGSPPFSPREEDLIKCEDPDIVDIYIKEVGFNELRAILLLFIL
jgi:hypothetical protein